ncbi:hypothetical protein IQ277_00680 [Nostocales cyanobacterium LEGE 12452]|nr:hypothetical protein [Nostocales cyanobacterium LEGE 12452]
MADIKVNDLLNLNPAGAELFNDSESFMKDLSDENEQMGVIGGMRNLSDVYDVYCLLPTCLDTGAVGSNTVIIVHAV